MAGLPGTGKSALAVGLAEALPAVLLDKDRVRAALFAPADVEYSTRQDDFCLGIMLQVAGYLWWDTPRRHVILDGRPFARRYQRAEVASFAAEHHVLFRLIECVCTEETALRRLLSDTEAATHLARNRDYQLYRGLKASFEPIEEPKLVVDTDEPYQTCLERCLSYLREETGA